MACDHVKAYIEKNGVRSYEILNAFYVTCIAKDALYRKARDCICSAERCEMKYLRVHACLSCIYFGCFPGRHIHKHAEVEKHEVAVDTNSGHVHCFVCGDYQYDPEFEKIARQQKLIAARRSGVPLKWEPTAEEVALLKKHLIINVAEVGLRGIINMGNTCYISVILQSLVHAPLFRDYFLSLQHKCSFQKKALESKKTYSKSAKLPACFACEMSDIIQEFFAGNEEPFVPNRLLQLLWTRESEFKGYKQQDAHEFLFVLLDNLHLDTQDPNGNSVSSSNYFCKCFIDKIFTGFSKYVYTCQKCCNEYSENTPFKDLALISQMSTDDDTASLADCLKMNSISVVPEVLCTECNQKKPFNVQMSLLRLPLIISFHVNQLCAKKKFISFPEFLDMTPYVLPPKPRSNKDGKPFNSSSGLSSNVFYLIAVVEHMGNEEAGHYVCYIRRLKKWFSCNDASIREVTVEEVLKKKAYLLFYHKYYLEYEVKDEKGHST